MQPRARTQAQVERGRQGEPSILPVPFPWHRSVRAPLPSCASGKMKNQQGTFRKVRCGFIPDGTTRALKILVRFIKVQFFFARSPQRPNMSSGVVRVSTHLLMPNCCEAGSSTLMLQAPCRGRFVAEYSRDSNAFRKVWRDSPGAIGEQSLIRLPARAKAIVDYASR